MLQHFDATNLVRSADGDGSSFPFHVFPAGGSVLGCGISIRWQDGPLGRAGDRVEPNGAFVETVLAAALQRLQWYQTVLDGKYACRENALAVTKIEEALHWLNARTQRREREGVEGTHTPDFTSEDA